MNENDDSGASAGITNNGHITVSIGDGQNMLQTSLTIDAANHFAKMLLLSIDAAKGMKS